MPEEGSSFARNLKILKLGRYYEQKFVFSGNLLKHILRKAKKRNEI